MIFNLFIKNHDDLMSKIVIEFDPIEIALSFTLLAMRLRRLDGSLTKKWALKDNYNVDSWLLYCLNQF